ncbi:MAG: Transposase IS200 like protein [Syntrophorhabdus sp. PtaU1.Bin050]|nr:MAG: Transposase IS200 like protein [Syntrophorhabdus sp. PtaU1.Bin050]
MPRQPRLDVPGTLHHVIVRGIEQSNIFKDNKDRQWFLDRLADIVEATGTKVYAWALIPNHVHLLLRSGAEGLPTFMRRLLTGYATYHNKRYTRSGHLFQNRYKSIVCEEEPYFLELVRYIHLNPLRSHVVKSIEELNKYPWSGHKALLAKATVRFQDRDSVLLIFADKEKRAQEAYRRFVEQGVSQGHRPEFTGGGLIRSVGKIRNQKDRVLTDERILGTGEFVKSLVEKATSQKQRLSPSERAEKIQEIIRTRCEADQITPEALASGSRSGSLPEIRSELTLQLVKELGLSYAEIGRHLGITASGVCKILARARGNKCKSP